MEAENFFIKNNYKSRKTPRCFNDNEEDALTYQVDVYRYAGEIAQRINASRVLDLGCGYALKLREYLLPFAKDIVGIDGAHAVKYCNANHHFGEWLVDDIEHPRVTFVNPFDLIISADVIEHLVNPDTVLDYIARHSTRQTLIIISTPERDLRRGPDDMGPPKNPAHVREWNQAEFAVYLRTRGYEILEHSIMDLKDGMRTCQTALCRLK